MTKQRLRANDDTHLFVVGFNKGARGGIVKVVNNGQADFTRPKGPTKMATPFFWGDAPSHIWSRRTLYSPILSSFVRYDFQDLKYLP